MTREQFRDIIRWPWIIWLVGIVNPFFMVPQLWAIWDTKIVDNISLLSLAMIFGIQAGFGMHGFFLRDRALTVSNTAAAFVSFITASLVLYIKYVG